jgi:hypothetical protein
MRGADCGRRRYIDMHGTRPRPDNAPKYCGATDATQKYHRIKSI